MTDSTAMYAAQCPPWCDRQHSPFLALDNGGPAELVIHTRQLLDQSPAAATAGLAVTIEQYELHPDCDQAEAVAGPHLVVTPHREHADLGVTPAELRGWSVLLDLAADRATELLAEADR